MLSDPCMAVSVSNVSKVYITFDSPVQRLIHLLSRGRMGRHADHVALSDVSFNVQRGETVGIVGRNGSGKSTLLSIVCGTLMQTRGDVHVGGRMAALLELGAGLNPELTGRENIPLAAQIYGLNEQEALIREQSIIEFADIAEYIDQPVKTYSSGMFTRLAFAIIANVDAELLVVDEALAVGDAFFVQKCMRFLRRFTENGGTLLFVSHDMGSVTALCDRALWLENGRVRMDGSPKEVANGYLADIYRHNDAAQVVTQNSARPRSAAERSLDVRHDLLLSSTLRNDLRVISYSFDSAFGAGGARITDVDFTDAEGAKLPWVVGGEIVRIRIEANALVDVDNVIVGFVVKDRNGQPLFGDNTYLSYVDDPCNVAAGGKAVAVFEFVMPIMPKGAYSLGVAVSEGTQESHVVHDWIHDALILESTATSLATGLVGVPMRRIEITSQQEGSNQ